VDLPLARVHVVTGVVTGEFKAEVKIPRQEKSAKPGETDIATGLALARSVLLRVAELGLLAGTEFLDPIVPQYVGDLISWTAIGARTAESQTHRQMASGLSMPVGFKNSTDGSLQNALNAVLSARHPHAFLGLNGAGATAVVKTRGNPDGHVVLRGGGGQSNYHSDDLRDAISRVRAEAIARGVLVDCSHDNSGKDHRKQAAVFRDVVASYDDEHRGLLGTMIESNLKFGRQDIPKDLSQLVYGQSVTDGCIAWDTTEDAIRDMRNKLKDVLPKRRNA